MGSGGVVGTGDVRVLIGQDVDDCRLGAMDTSGLRHDRSSDASEYAQHAL